MTFLPTPSTCLQLTRADSEDFMEGSPAIRRWVMRSANSKLSEIKRYNIDATRLRLPKVIERVDVLDADGVVLFHV